MQFLRYACGQTDRQTDRQTNRQTDRQTCILIAIIRSASVRMEQ